MGMTRTAAHPQLSTRTITRFLGMVTDRSGVEMSQSEFSDIKNIDHNGTSGLRKRRGSEKYGEVVHAEGDKVQKLFTFRDDDGTETFMKISDGKLWKWNGSIYVQVDNDALTDAASSVAIMQTKEVGGASIDNGTSTDSDPVSISDSAAAYDINEHVGKIMVINDETKFITNNTSQKMLVGDRFDNENNNNAYNIYNQKRTIFIATGSEFFKANATTIERIDNASDYAYAFNRIATHEARLWGIIENKAHYSDIGVGEHFSRGALFNFPYPLVTLSELDDVLAFYGRKGISIIYGDNPDNFFRQVAMTDVGCMAPDSVASYPGHQFFLDDILGVVILSRRELREENEGVEPVSVSYDYINEDIFSHTTDELEAANGYVKGDYYYLRIGDDVYKLNVTASLSTPQRFGKIVWMWSKEEYPDAIIPNAMGVHGTSFVFGSASNGQVYEVHKDDVFDDDGDEIEMVIEKMDWNANKQLSDKNYDSMHIIMDTTTELVNLLFFFSAGSDNYGHSENELDLSIVTGRDPRDHEVPVPSNPGDPHGKKDVGRLFSFKIFESGRNEVPEIESLELHYTPGIVT